MHLNPNLEKFAIKLENRRESALILEKVLFNKFHLNAVYTRIAFYANLWFGGVCPLEFNAISKLFREPGTDNPQVRISFLLLGNLNLHS